MQDNDELWARLSLLDSGKVLETLQKVNVLLVGCGGLGSEVALRLAGSNIERITIVDGDVVSLPNIPHCPLFLPSHVGQKKVAIVASYLQGKFPALNISPMPLFIQQCDEKMFSEYDIILCAPDNDKTRLWVNYYAVMYNKPVVFLGLGNVEY